MKKNQKEELQSRREFFKKAAKGALPILGAIVMAGTPVFVKAAEKTPTECTGCSYSCYHNCYSGCDRTCYGTCKGTCQESCKGTCRGTCSGSCSGGCYYTEY